MGKETNSESNNTLFLEKADVDDDVVFQVGSIGYAGLENLLNQPQQIFGR